MNKTSHAIVRTLLLGTSCLSVAGVVVGDAIAQPTGGQVVLGTATITDKGPNSTVIDQKTGKAIINWNSFSIGAGGTVKFNQPNANSIALNRVLGGEGSSIYGNLLANGQVWIINQNGILFGKGSTINVGGLIATTRDVSDTNFAAGNYSFSGDSGASVVNQGTIRTRNGGDVVLSGASVQNQGLVQADTGTVVLGGAAAFTVDFTGDGLLKYAITQPTGAADNGQTGVSNSGTITAAGGRVIMTARAAAEVQGAVVNNTGMISATSAKLQNGEVVLDGGDGDVNAGGTINASGAARGQTGGFVSITGRNVTVADNTNINVSGDAGGGTVKIGGDVHGQGTLQNAANTLVGRATINADATRTGNGGTLVVWSNGITDFSGIFSAKGGTLIGNGGFIETSGRHLNISPDAKVDTTARHGQTGTWLLDPDAIVITSGEGANTSLDGSGRLALGTDSEDTDFISPTTIINALATTNVTLEAASYIEVDSDVIYASAHSLSLMSEGNIYVYASLQNSQASGGGGINLVAGWDGVTAPGQILATPGSYGADDGEGGRGLIEFLGDFQNVYVGSASGTTMVAGFAALLATDEGGNVQLGYHGNGGGNINVFLNSDLALIAGSPSDEMPFYAQIGNGALDGSVSGPVTGDIHIQIEGNLDLATGFTNCDCDNTAQSGTPAPQRLGNGIHTIGIGNESADATPTGSVLLFGNDVDDSADENGGFGQIIFRDIAYGDVVVGRFDTETPMMVGGASYNSAHNLTLLSKGDILVDSSLLNDGSGAITLLAGWSGLYDPSHFGADGTYGLNNGTITVGGPDAIGDVFIGTHSGALTLYGANLTVDASVGNAQLGYHGAGGGNIFITMTGDVTVQGGGDTETAAYAQIGNGSLLDDVEGNVTGNISIKTNQFTSFDGDNGEAWLGNVAGTGSTETGDVQLLTRFGFFSADYIAADLQGGNVFVGFTDPTVTPLFIGGFHYNAPHDFTFAGAGSMNITGGVQNAGAGAITLVAGWDGHTVGTAAQIKAANAFGLGGASMNFGAGGQFEDAEVGSAHGLTSILTGDLILAPASGFNARIGFNGDGGGDINVFAKGAVSLSATNASAIVQIGNAADNGAATGNVTVDAASLTISASGNGSLAEIGNTSNDGGSESGNVTINTHSGALSVSASATAAHAHIGNWTNGDTTGTSSGTITIDSGALTLASSAGGYTQVGNGAFRFGDDSGAVSGSITIHATTFGATSTGSAQSRIGNMGIGAVSGDILIVTTGNYSSTGDNGLVSVGNVFAGMNSNGDLVQGQATGNLTVQSGGTVTLTGINSGFARIETGGGISGAVSVTAAGDITLTGGITNGAAATGGGAIIGALPILNTSISVSVVSTNGSVRLTSNASSTTLIGVNPNGAQSGTQSGAILVSAANGNVFITGTGQDAAAGIGNIGYNGGTLSGDVTVTAGQAIGLNGGHIGQIDDSDPGQPTPTIGGTVTLTANAITSTAGTPAITGGTLRIVQTGTASSIGTSTNALAFKAGTLNLTGTGSTFFLASQGAVAISGAALSTGILNMTSAGAITQTGAITAARLILTTTSGGIGLTSTTNAVTGQSVFNTPGSVTFYNTLTTSIGAGSIGGDLTLLSKNNVNIQGNIQLNTGAITLLAGWDGTTTNAANFGNTGVFGTGTGGVVAIGGGGASGNVALGSKSGTTTLYGKIVAVNAINGNAQLGYHGTGGGAITVRALGDVNLNAPGAFGAMLGNGSLTTDVTGNITGDIDLRAGGNLNFTGTNVQLGNLAHSGTETGNLTLVIADQNGADNQFSGFLLSALSGGDVTLGFTGPGDQGPESDLSANSSHNLTVLTVGNLVMAGSMLNAGTGAIILVAGWDGHTLSGFANSGVAGNSGKGVVIGGANAAGNVAVGSAGGQTSVYGASLAITAANGYAQLGFHGHGTGAILVNVSGALSITGGSGTGQFAQLGNGGLKTSGNNSGDINVKAGGAITLTSGAGTEAYVQLGHGGAESNTAAQQGYSNQGSITVAGQDIILNAGLGQAAYVQIGHGGYKVGAGITGGTATNSGAITITSAHTVALNGNGAANAGTDAYVQIGNGGGQSNLNPAAAAGGTDGGDIVVTAPNGAAGSVTMTAGFGANAYAMIGNGGYAANSGATSTLANWTITGNITVTDLALTGGQGSGNEFSVIGNGDASKNSVGNVSGNITINANGQITYTNGKAPTSIATIGNFTGTGTTSGTLTGAQPPSAVTTDPVIIGITTVNTADNNNNNGNNNITTINTTVVPATQDTSGGATNVPPPSAATTPGALASLDNGGDSSTPNNSDSATTLIADSLDGAKKSGSTTLLAGMLKQTNTTSASNTMHGVPPADQDFSSWGNEALWQ